MTSGTFASSPDLRCLLRPFVQGILRGTLPLRLGNVVCEGIELALHSSAMLLENLRQGAERRVVGTEPGGLNKLVGQVDSQLVLPSIAHSSSCDHPLTLRLGG